MLAPNRRISLAPGFGPSPRRNRGCPAHRKPSVPGSEHWLLRSSRPPHASHSAQPASDRHTDVHFREKLRHAMSRRFMPAVASAGIKPAARRAFPSWDGTIRANGSSKVQRSGGVCSSGASSAGGRLRAFHLRRPFCCRCLRSGPEADRWRGADTWRSGELADFLGANQARGST